MQKIKQISQAKDIFFQNNEDLEVYLFNVGQGDHIMLKFPQHEYGIIDFFYDSSVGIWEPPALSYFKELKDTLSKEEFEKIVISFFCISHTDKDHIKGVCEAIKWFHDNKVLIREFWLPAALDATQFSNFLQTKLPNFFSVELMSSDRTALTTSMILFNEYITEFFDYFEKWKNKEFESAKKEKTGSGEYLGDIRPLCKPCSEPPDCLALNIGPLGKHIKEYEKNLSLDIFKTILGYKKDPPDKNMISHILRIDFGDSQLLFGGDTHRDIWEDCLDRYNSTRHSYKDKFGPIDCHFIKVSHHGSVNSSSPAIWSILLNVEHAIHLGISAGNHYGYQHPHTKTIEQIKNANKDSTLLSTNICLDRIKNADYEQENHIWYDKYVNREFLRGLPPSGKIETHEIQQSISTTKGLFAYIFKIPHNKGKSIKIRMALSKTNKVTDCFHLNYCNQDLSSCKKIIFQQE